MLMEKAITNQKEKGMLMETDFLKKKEKAITNQKEKGMLMETH